MTRRLVAYTLATIAAAATRDTPAQEASVLIVEELAADSAAARAGVAVGDRLVTYDEQPLPSPAALQAFEENRVAASPVTLRVRRGDETLLVSAPRGALGLRVRPPLAGSTLALYEEGTRALAAGRIDAAVDSWSAAAAAARGAGDRAGAAWLFGLVGAVHEDERRWKEASEAHASAKALLEASGDSAATSRTLMALARCSERLGDVPAAEQWYRQAAQVSEAAGHEMWLAAALAGVGDAATSRRDLPRAREEHGRALRIRERLAPESLEVASSLYGLARAQWLSRDLPAAQDLASRALGIRERLAPESVATAASLSLLGILAREHGDLTAAEDFYRRALAIRERVAPPDVDLSGIINNIGDVARMRGDLGTAHDYFVRALEMQEKLGTTGLSVATYLGNLGVVARLRGDMTAAEDYQKRALAIRERLAPGSIDVAYGLNNLGNIAKDRGDLAAAEDYHQRSLAIKERMAPVSEDVASSLFNLGGVAHSRGDLAEAHAYHRRALEMRERLTPQNPLFIAESLNSLGSVARDRGDLAVARTALDRALAMRENLAPNSLIVAETLDNLGMLARAEGELGRAQDYLVRSIGIRERLAPAALPIARSLNLLGAIAADERRFSDALRLFTRAADIVEARRWEIRTHDGRALLLAQNADAHAGLVRIHVALGDLPAAFAAAERARARSLLEHLSEARADIREGVDPDVLNRERLLQRRINDRARQHALLLANSRTQQDAERVQQELDGLLAEYRELQAAIRDSSPRYAALTQPQPLALADIQRDVLDEATVLLEYVLGEERSHVFAVTASRIDVFELPSRAVIEQAARRVYERLVARQTVSRETASQRTIRIERADADYPAAAHALSRMVLQPVAQAIAGRRLLIVADGALQYVPFAALPRPGQAASPRAEPLVVGHEIVSVPSASVIPVLRRDRASRRRADRTVAVVADPVFDADDSRVTKRQAARQPPPLLASLPADITRSARAAGLTDDRGTLARLPFTRDEADSIVALAPPGAGTRTVDFRASRATITSQELGRYRIVHLATHGLLDAERPELSGLVLSLVDEQGRPQDGFLRLHEVYNLDWSAELVVLSACQTALGREIKGEGLVGLTRGFMYSGAERVMASLWNVNDSVTAQFMRHFYEGLLAKRRTPAAALRAAQIDMWRRQPARSPYYWAAFVLQGEWR